MSNLPHRISSSRGKYVVNSNSQERTPLLSESDSPTQNTDKHHKLRSVVTATSKAVSWAFRNESESN